MRFNKAIEAMQPSVSVVLMEKAKAMKASGVDVINLAGGEPNFDTPEKVSYRAISELTAGNTHYVAGAGLPELRERIALMLREEQGVACSKENILITPGGKFAIYLAARVLLNEGDEVLIPQPSWVSYTSIVQAAGGVAVPVDLSFEDNYLLTREALEQKVSAKTRMLIINTPNNPTGRMLNAQEIGMIHAFAAEHDIIVLSDEIYSGIAYDGNRHISLGAAPDALERVIIVNGFSKSAAMTGWRLGYLCMNADIIKQAIKLYQHTMTCIAGFMQQAAVVACGCKEELAYMNAQYAQRRQAFIGALQQIEGVDIRMPDGAFYAWMQVKKGSMTDVELCSYLLEKAHVAGVPGSAFGAVGTPCVRFSFASSMEELTTAAQRIAKAINAL